MRAAPDEQWHETEQALRRLLRDVVPQTAGPADRMTRIRRRVQRRRRPDPLSWANRTWTAVRAADRTVVGLPFEWRCG
ncbi:hypothetical protein ABZ312_43590, partial [Streptomyces sp. NPDC006207]